jgi:hypothetical protein
MRTIILFINCDTADMSAFASLEAFQRYYPSFRTKERNANGDLVVERGDESFPRYVGYLQERQIIE